MLSKNSDIVSFSNALEPFPQCRYSPCLPLDKPKMELHTLLGDLPCISLGTYTPQISAIGKMNKIRKIYLSLFSIRNFALRDPSERGERKTLPCLLWNPFPKGFTLTTQGYLKIFETLHNAYKTIQMSKPWKITRKCGCCWFPEKCFHHTNTVEGEIKEKERLKEPRPDRVRNPSMHNFAELTHWHHRP